METLTKNKIPFTELDEDRRWEIVYDHIQFYDGWWENIQETFEADLEQHGLYNVDIMWSGFHSQGDGASFTASVELKEFFNKHYKEFEYDFDRDGGGDWGEELLEEMGANPKFLVKEAIEDGLISVNINRISCHRYFHENTVDFDVEQECLPDGWNKEIDKFTKYLEEYGGYWLKAQCKELYRRLENGYEDFQKDEYDYFMEMNETYTP